MRPEYEIQMLTLLRYAAIQTMTHVPGPLSSKTSAKGMPVIRGDNVTW